jgi:hypothetical protein
MDRVLVGLSPNWNSKTVLYNRFSRLDPASGTPGVILGPAPTFGRTISNSQATATYLGRDDRFHTLATNIARYEESRSANAWRRLYGLRSFGAHRNYFQPSHPTSAALQWSLTSPSNGNISGNALWSWAASLPSVYADLPVVAGGADIGLGTGLFNASNGDFIQILPSTYGGSGIVSLCVWVRGEGTAQLEASGVGSTTSSASTILSSSTWTALKIENVNMNGSALTVRLYSRETTTWCSVSAMQMIRAPRVYGYTYNPSTSAATLEEDALFYNLQIPIFTAAIHVGLEMPDLYASGEQVILGVDQTAGNRFVLRYNATTAKFSFQRKTSSPTLEWTPQRAAGQPTIISLILTKDAYVAYENGTNVASIAANAQTVVKGLNIGWDGVTDTLGWNGLVYFVRIDDQAVSATEISYISALYNDAQMIPWTKMLEGRLFEIKTPAHRIRAGMNFASLDLEQVDGYEHATTELP